MTPEAILKKAATINILLVGDRETNMDIWAVDVHHFPLNISYSNTLR